MNEKTAPKIADCKSLLECRLVKNHSCPAVLRQIQKNSNEAFLQDFRFNIILVRAIVNEFEGKTRAGLFGSKFRELTKKGGFGTFLEGIWMS